MNYERFTLKRKWERLLFVFVFFTAICTSAYAQNGLITGKVTDGKTNETIIGAAIRIKGTTTGVVTDADGNFKINATAGQTLQITYIGYDPVEVAVSNSPISIKLTAASNSLSEVVVVGYGTQKKETLTGSISTVSAKAFQDKGTITNPLEALQGQVPGVVITRQSSAPGNEAWGIQIRGATSVSGSNPLYVIDGIAVSDNNALNALNPNDIESMSFLKDASAAIYGARAAGGVVLITTKKAKSGKITVEYNGSFSDKIIGLVPQQMSLQQYASGLLQARGNDGFGVNDQWIQLANLMLKYQGQVINTKTFKGDGTFPAGNPIPGFGDVSDYPLLNTNFNDLLYKNGSSTEQNFSIAGRTDKAGYRLSVGYTYDGGLLRYGDNNNNRYNIRFTNDYQLSDKLKLESNVAMDMDNVVTPTQIGSILGPGFQPGFPAFAQNGAPYAWGGNYTPEGYAKFGGDNKSFTTRWYINEKLSYDITKHLSLIVNLGYDPTTISTNAVQNTIQWYDYSGTVPGNINPTQPNSYYSEGNTTDNYYNANAYLQYRNTFAKKHEVGITLGSQYERDEYNMFSATTFNQFSPNVPALGLGIGDNTSRSDAGAKNHYAIGSYFGRFNYAYDNKYLIEGDARYDGSSKFTASSRWKPFYGVSGGWRITQEPFMKNLTFFNELKLRASYGTAGNQNGIGLYDYIQLLNVGYSTGSTSNYPILGTSPAVTLGPTSNLVSLQRTWEKVETTNLALDFAVLNNRLTGTGEVFVKNNANMLLPITYPAVLGATAPLSNSGYLRSKGWEVNLTWADKVGNLSYHIGGNLTYNTNKLLNYGGQSVISAGINGPIQGQPLNSVYGLQYAGRIQNQAQLTQYVNTYINGNSIGLPTTLRVGDNMFKDVNGDGKLTNADYVKLGTEDPRYSYSFNAGLAYKGLDFAVVFQGVWDRTIYRATNARIPFQVFYNAQDNFSVGKTWTPTNTGAYYPLLSSTGTYNNYNYQPSSFSVENGAYLRLKNVVLGYTLPSSFIQRTKFLSKVRVYVSANDLFEITKIHDGFDPEAVSSILNNNFSNLGAYPFYRLVTAGVNVTF